MNSTIIPIAKEAKDKCKAFSESWFSTSKQRLKERNQNDKDKAIADHCLGKIAECGVYIFLKKNLGVQVTQPDFKIYGSWDKTFEADLTCGKYRIHVKSCRKDSQFPISWGFQSGGNAYKHIDPIITTNDPFDYVAFVTVGPSDIEIKAIVPARLLREYKLYKDPTKAALKGLKKFIYWSDLVRLPKEMVGVEAFSAKLISA